jgi:hypothetical protein
MNMARQLASMALLASDAVVPPWDGCLKMVRTVRDKMEKIDA